ncbi:rho-related protein racA-like isoform X1 [Physella acuta]|uniref:rho-related protein racA-like isoform X1 n=1 Tax=Physella acuta TaxID=109671 RepID=UPI0027DCB827|nr:rho-related protein racA-like isoform X1 [Physella acuta]
MDRPYIKLVVIGDGGVGKTCMLMAYTTKDFPRKWLPRQFDNCSFHYVFSGKPVIMAYLDIVVDLFAEDVRQRYLYRHTNVFLACYSMGSRESFLHLKEKWIPDFQAHGPKVPFVIVATKLDLRHGAEDTGENLVSYGEGHALAKSLNAPFIEISALTREGLDKCFEIAAEQALSFMELNQTNGLEILDGSSTDKPVLMPPVIPVLPNAGKAPWMEIETSEFAGDWLKTLQDPKFHDVTFLVEGVRRLHAHRIILSSASKLFGQVLASTMPCTSSQLQELNQIDSFQREDLNAGKVEGTPNLPEDCGEDEIQELRKVSLLFQLPYLTTICDNILKKEEFLNPSIGTYLTDETVAKMKELFFNQEANADVVFCVEDRKIFAHKVVLYTRSHVMAAMFSGTLTTGSQEIKDKPVEININNTSAENFLALLEYLYTDHAPLEESEDLVGILALADENCLPRLANLCELYLSKEVDKACQAKIQRAEIDVIGVLNTAQMLNAKQLSRHCLYLISTNYLDFANRIEFNDLSYADRAYVENHRWLPLGYLKDVQEYENAKDEKGGNE